jgi:hypothetical protein
VNDEERSRFLPPEPTGPEPELGGRPAPPPPQAPSPPPAAAPPPPPAYGQPQGGYQQPPPPGGWYPPVTQGGWQQQPPPQAWGYPQQRVPDNNQAVAGFILSLVGGGLLLISAGLSTLLSVGLSIAGMVLGRKGVRRVDAGETPKNRSLGQAGFWIGLVSLIFSVIATAIWVAILIAALTDDEFQRDLEREFDESQSLSVVAATAVRLALHLVA